MPRPKYCTDRASTCVEKAQIHFLLDQLQHSSSYLGGDVFSDSNARLQYLLQGLQYRGIDLSQI